MRYTVKGAHRDSGAEMQATMEAASPQIAENLARHLGMLVESVTPARSEKPADRPVSSGPCPSCGRRKYKRSTYMAAGFAAAIVALSLGFLWGRSSQESEAVANYQVGIPLALSAPPSPELMQEPESEMVSIRGPSGVYSGFGHGKLTFQPIPNNNVTVLTGIIYNDTGHTAQFCLIEVTAWGDGMKMKSVQDIFIEGLPDQGESPFTVLLFGCAEEPKFCNFRLCEVHE
jgi:hypothetical protein